MTAFNRLSPAQAERLAILIEECGEVVQAATKILRHGYESSYADGRTNLSVLESEIGDLEATIAILGMAGDISPTKIRAAKVRKFARVVQYLHEQPDALIEALQIGDVRGKIRSGA